MRNFSSSSNNGVVILIFVVIFVLAFWLNSVQVHGQHDQISAYGARHGQYVQKIEQPMFNHGPYWYQKGDRVYRATAEDVQNHQTVYWFRFRMWRTPAVERADANGYTELDFNE